MAVLAPERPAVGLGGDLSEAYGEFCRGYRRLLSVIAEHDRCEAYRVLGVRREEDYLCRVFDLRWPTAKDWTREARLVGAHPEIGERLASGTLSLDRFRKMAEVVEEESPESLRPPGPFGDSQSPKGPEPGSGTDIPPTPPGPEGSGDDGGDGDPPDDGGAGAGPEPRGGQEVPAGPTLDELMAMLDELTAKQLAAKAAAARAEARQRDRHRTRHLDLLRVDGEGRLSLRGGQLFDDDAAVVWAAFEDYASRTGKNPETGEWDPLAMRHADALRAMADAYLARRERDIGHPLVVFHAAADLIAGDEAAWAAAGADHSPLGVDAVRRLGCFSKINLSLDDPDGNPLFLGRAQRLASWQQEYMVIWRDGACRGCGSTVGLEIHHLREWTAELGLTDVDQLISSCRTCHHLNHDRHWRFEGDANGEVRFLDPMRVVRSRSRPHPRFSSRRRPPRDWLSDPPEHEAPDGGASTGPEPHGPEPHGPEPHGPEPHGPEPHGPEPHGPEPHGPEPPTLW
jgi:hypothetical protein